MMHHDPVNWTFQQWLMLLLFPLCGGTISYYQHCLKRKYGKEAVFKPSRFLAELFTSGFVGIIVAFWLVSVDWEAAPIYATIGFSGYFANRFLFLGENIAECKFITWSGVNKEEFKSLLKSYGQFDFDTLESFAECESQGVCLHAWQAFYMIELGMPMRHISWPHGQFVSMPTTGKIQVKSEDLWSDPNAKFAKTQPGQVVLVMPSISVKLPTGQILPGWTPSVQDLSIPGWSRVSDQEIAGKTEPSRSAVDIETESPRA